MSIFSLLADKFRPLEKSASDAVAALQFPARKPALTPPKDMGRTMNSFPENFVDYRYVGPTIGTDQKNRRGIVARLILAQESEAGAFSEIEMTASVQDLRAAKFYEKADAIAERLHNFYVNKVFGAVVDDMPPLPAKNHASEAKPAAHKTVGDNLFSKLNNF